MQVKQILDKVVNDQPDVLAVLVRHGGHDYQNLKPPYDMLPSFELLATVSDVFDLSNGLEEEGYQIGDMILSFDEHSVVSRKIDDGTVVVLTKALARSQLIKLQVGLGLYIRALQKALAETDHDGGDAMEVAPVAARSGSGMSAPAQANGIARGWGKMIGKAILGDRTPSPAGAGPSEAEIAAAIKAGKKVRHYRGQAYID